MHTYHFNTPASYDNSDLKTLENILNESTNMEISTHYPHQATMIKAGETLLKHLNTNNIQGIFCAINILNIEQATIYNGANKSLNIWKEILDAINVQLPQNAYIGKVNFGIALHFWSYSSTIVQEFEEVINTIQSTLDTLRIKSIQENDFSFHLTLFSKSGYVVYPQDTGKLESYIPLTKYAVMATINSVAYHYHSSISRFSQERYSHLQSKILLEAKIFKQVTLKEFSLVYQPQMNLHTNQVIGAEALSYFQNMPYTSQYNTSYYIDILENSKYILEFTYASFEKLVLFLETYESKLSQNFSIGFNLSRSIFKWSHFDVIQMIEEILHNKKYLIKYIQIEMTESAYFTKELSTSVLKTLENLHHLGFKISIDDFGTGYGSLTMMSSGYIDSIKLDRSMIKQLCNKTINTNFIESLLYAVKQHDFKVIVEGIETQEEEKVIQDLGLIYAQGYKYSKNLSQDDFLHFIEETNTKLL